MAKYFYHYTTLKKAREIARGQEYKGLKPNGRHMSFDVAEANGFDPNEVSRSAVYGFLKMFPEEWVEVDSRLQKPHVEILMTSNGFSEGQLVLFKCEITDKDEAYVMDMGVFDGVPLSETEKEWKTNQPAIQAAYKKYWESRIPFNEYDPDKHKMKLPEAVIFNKIPTKRMQMIMKARRIDILNHARVKSGLPPLPKKPRKAPRNMDKLLDGLKLE